MPNTYKKIATVVVGSGGSSAINFTSIPQTYTDLQLVSSLRVTYDGGNSWIDGIVTFNGTSTNYAEKFLFGDGDTAGTSSQSSTGLKWAAFAVDSGATASVFSNNSLYIPNYTSANNKSGLSDSVTENNATNAQQSLHGSRWSNSAAITQITITPGFGSFVQYSTATLYGIGDVTASKFAKATGGLITYDSTYVYHTFTSSGTFTPNTALTADYLVVAGGGGGGGDGQNTGGGGGGAGGLRCTIGATGGGGSLETPLSLSSGSAYTVTVGGGGTGSTSRTNNGTNGSNSVFASITSTGGGRAGFTQSIAGVSGGSGGGGNYGAVGGTGTTNQGYSGGTGGFGDNRPGGGGGGANAVGGNASGIAAGNGGNGVTTSISGTSTVYAGGGGGGTWNGGTRGTGGTGGGGNAGTVSGNNSGSAGTTNTGGGGGGGSVQDSGQSNGGAGGSGIVIVRYPR
jgi:hypothetical protein